MAELANTLPADAVDILHVDDLHTQIETKNATVRAVDGVSFSIRGGEIFGLVGESGSGKSLTAFSILGLLPNRGRIAQGSVRFKGVDLAKLPRDELRGLRGDRIAMIFQDPMSSLNPVLRVGEQIAEVLREHRNLSAKEARDKVVELMRLVEIPSPETRYFAYPHEFSGGMRQRIVIAMALACQPDLLIADEPTTALDVTVERQILFLLQELRRKTGAAILLITHNLALMAENCERVAVMYAGQIVEMAETRTLFDNPLHPYTRALLASLPREHISQGRLTPLTGLPPTITGARRGCSFAPRCTFRLPHCTDVVPEILEVEPGHFVRCHLYPRES